MKTLLLSLALLLVIGQANASSVATWYTENLTDLETQLVDDASPTQLKELTDCAADQGESDLSKTSCINEVLGDI